MVKYQFPRKANLNTVDYIQIWTSVAQVILSAILTFSIFLSLRQTEATEKALILAERSTASSSRAVLSAQVFDLERALLENPDAALLLKDAHSVPGCEADRVRRDALADMILTTLESVWLQSDYLPELDKLDEWCQFGAFAYAYAGRGTYVFNRLEGSRNQYAPGFYDWIVGYKDECANYL